MFRKIILLTGLCALLLPAAAVLAGGWVVITLDPLPEQIRAGEPLELSFMIRQHGQTPTHAVTPILSAMNKETGERIQVDAVPAKELGRFLVPVNFPRAGAWEWSISAEPFPQTATFAPLTVLTAQGTVATGVPHQPVPGVQLALRWSALALLVIGAFLILLDKRRRREAPVPASGD